MTSHRAPKQWSLSSNETITLIDAWENNLILSLDPNFADFLTDGSSWGKKTNATVLRGFSNNPECVPAARRRTAAQKVTHLEMMLGQIENYAPIISRSSIVKNSTSISRVWQMIRQHYGLQLTGSHFLDLANISLKREQRLPRIYFKAKWPLLKTTCAQHPAESLIMARYLSLTKNYLHPKKICCSYLVTPIPSKPSAACETALWNRVT